MATARALDPITKHRSRGPKSTRSKSTHVRKSKLSEIDLPLTCRHMDASGTSDLHRTCESSGRHKIKSNDRWPTRGLTSTCDDQIGRLELFVEENHDRGAIEPRSWLICRDRGTRSRHDWWPTIFVQSWPPIGTQSRIKRPAIFGQKSSLKTDVLPLIW